LYTTDNCARCVTAKTLLTRRGVGYEEVNLTKDPDGRAELARRTGMITFPQLVVGEETLGGLDELVAADRAGALKSLRDRAGALKSLRPADDRERLNTA
jgi:glutaredoxin 3